MTDGAVRAAVFAAIARRWFYGWTIVGVTGLGVFASGVGQSHIFSVFIGPIGRDLGLSRAAIASAYGIATLAAACCLPFAGRLVDRFGARRMTAGVVLALGAACLALGAAPGLLWLAAGFAALRCLGMGALMLGCTNLVSQWFSRRRGVALSLMALGFAASLAIHPPLGQYLVETVGWRRAWLVLGLVTWALMLPPVLLLVHDRPEDLGLRPDGERPGPGDDEDSGRAASGLALREALGTPAFYIVGAGFFTTTMMATALHFYQVSILGAQGVGPEIAARVFPVSALTMVVAMPFVGRLFDRRRTRHVFAGGLVVTGVALVGVTLVHDLATAVLYAMLFGVNNAWTMTVFGYMWPRYFGRRHLGSIQGVGQMIGAVGAALGPLPVGLAFDLAGSATATLRLLALAPIGCAAAALFLRTPAAVTGGEHLE